MADNKTPTLIPAQLGRFWEDFEVGTVYQHPFGRTISETDSAWFTLLTCNTNQNHFNAHLAQSSPITGGRIIVNSGLTVALVLGLSVIDMSQNAVANLGWTDIKLTHPAYIGDTIYAESEVLEKRESKSRPTQGIVKIRTIAKKQCGTMFMSYERAMLMPKRGHAVDDKANY